MLVNRATTFAMVYALSKYVVPEVVISSLPARVLLDPLLCLLLKCLFITLELIRD
jgi:hypothetical protein